MGARARQTHRTIPDKTDEQKLLLTQGYERLKKERKRFAHYERVTLKRKCIFFFFFFKKGKCVEGHKKILCFLLQFLARVLLMNKIEKKITDKSLDRQEGQSRSSRK